jgi:hypothetical protein
MSQLWRRVFSCSFLPSVVWPKRSTTDGRKPEPLTKLSSKRSLSLSINPPPTHRPPGRLEARVGKEFRIGE